MCHIFLQSWSSKTDVPYFSPIVIVKNRCAIFFSNRDPPKQMCHIFLQSWSSKVSCRGLIPHRISWINIFSELYVLRKEFLWGRNGRFSTVERAILYMGGQNWCCWIIAIGQLFTWLTVDWIQFLFSGKSSLVSLEKDWNSENWNC